MSDIVEIGFLQPDEFDSAVTILIESFRADPTFEFILAKDQLGYEQRVATFATHNHQFYVNHHVPMLGAFVGGKLVGVLYGGFNAFSDQAGNNYMATLKTLFDKVVVTRIEEYIESTFVEKPDNSYLLDFIAVTASARGQGIGSALIKHVIHDCQQHKNIEHVALDTANQRNIDLYERLGFKTLAVKAFENNFCQTVMAYTLNY